MSAYKSLKLVLGAVTLAGWLAVAGPALAAAPAPFNGEVPAPAPTPTPAIEDDQRVIQGDQVVSGGSFTLQSGEVLRGNLTVFGGNATMDENSRVEGNVTVFGGNADVNGTITRDLTLLGGAAHLRSAARIEGKETVLGGSVSRDPGAVVNGQSTRYTSSPFNGLFPFSPTSPFRSFLNLVGNILSTIASVILITLLAIAVAALFPYNVARIADMAQQQWLVAGSVGILALVITPVALVLLAITICLIPAALVLLVAWVLAMLGGWTVAARILGERLAIGFKSSHWSVIGQTALGALVLAVVGALPLIGWLISFLATALGMGALLLTLAGTRSFPASSSGLSQLPSHT